MHAFLRRSSEAGLRLLRRTRFSAGWRWIRRRRYGATGTLPARDGAVLRFAAAGNPVIERKGELPVWVSLPCPCRCGTILRLNLMRSQVPVWRASIDDRDRLSITPSVDATACGSHFWVRDGRVDWVD